MQVIDGLENFVSGTNGSLTVGSFDGFHLGHQRIVRLMLKEARGGTTVLTFEPHPQTVVRPDIPPPPQLTSRVERIKLFEATGIDRLVFAKFDDAFAAISAEDYIKQVLIDKLGVKRLYIGPNHHFGKDRTGNAGLLTKMGKRLGFEVIIVEPVTLMNETISSSRIRKKLIAGDTLTAIKMLGKPFYLTGIVERGEGRGKKLGFPTANLGPIPEGKLMPPSGIYATVTEVFGLRWPSVSHIGPRPTFPGASPTIESHLISFDADLYDKPIKVGLVRRLRDIEAFNSVEKLIVQMELDKKLAIKSLADAGFGLNSHRKVFRLTANTSLKQNNS